MVQMQVSMCKGHGLSKLLDLAHLSERDVTENFSIPSRANKRQNVMMEVIRNVHSTGTFDSGRSGLLLCQHIVLCEKQVDTSDSGVRKR